MTAVQRIVSAVAHDDALLASLRHDPSALGRELGLTGEQVESLRAADRFFPTEKPILDAPPLPPAPPPSPDVLVRFVAGPLPSSIVVSADTGTLLPGANSGTVSVTGTAQPAPGPVPAAPHPPARPPVAPVAPQAPVVPRAPVPAMPPTPVPGAPGAVPGPAPPPCPQLAPCGCEAAIAAIVANASATAQTALAGIAAIAAQRSHGPPRGGQSSMP